MENEGNRVPVVLRQQDVARQESDRGERDVARADRRRLELVQRQKSREEIGRMAEPFRLDRRELAAMRMLDPNEVNSELGNAIRSLRQQILGKLGNRNGVVMVAGLVAGGGASFVARNLGAALALDEARSVLLLDCDMHGVEEAGNALVSSDLPGLTDFLDDYRLDEADIIYPSGIPRMRLVPRGTRRNIEGEQFSSVRMQELLENTARRYPDRYLVLDVPPLKLSADATMLARYCDLIILVVPYGRVMPGDIEQAIEALGEERILGIVFNREPRIPPLH